jgi:hypothetical protein
MKGGGHMHARFAGVTAGEVCKVSTAGHLQFNRIVHRYQSCTAGKQYLSQREVNAS